MRFFAEAPLAENDRFASGVLRDLPQVVQIHPMRVIVDAQHIGIPAHDSQKPRRGGVRHDPAAEQQMVGVVFTDQPGQHGKITFEKLFKETLHCLPALPRTNRQCRSFQLPERAELRLPPPVECFDRTVSLLQIPAERPLCRDLRPLFRNLKDDFVKRLFVIEIITDTPRIC